MAKRSFKLATWTPVAVADAANFTDNGYQALMGGSTTQRIEVTEIHMGGQEGSASKPCLMIVSRDSTVQATPTALSTGQSDAAIDPATAALAAPAIPFTASTTKPQRSATLGLLAVPFNAYGGIMRWWVNNPKSALVIVGNTASFGELSLSAYTGGTPGACGSHIVYEPI